MVLRATDSTSEELEMPSNVPKLNVPNIEQRSGRSTRPSRPGSVTYAPNSALSKSPMRTSDNHHYTTQRLRNPSFSGSQRRSSLSSVGDISDFSSSIGMPYSYSPFGSSSTVASGGLSSASSTRTTALPSTSARNPHSRGSPRNSITSSVDYSYSRRGSTDHVSPNPSTAEVFDQMEREQDAIVLKLMREISQLREDNRALVNTVNHLSNSLYASKSRNNSLSTTDEYQDLRNIPCHDPNAMDNRTN